MKRMIAKILFSLGILVLAGLLVDFSGWLLSFRFGGPTEIPEAVTLSLPAEQPAVGAPVPGELRFDLPLCRSVTGASVKPGAGSVAAGGARIEPGNWKFLRRNWRVVFDLRALHAGKVEPGTLTLELTGENPETVVRTIPGFSAAVPREIDPGKLELAGAIEIARPLPWGWVAAGAVLALVLAGVAAWLVRRRRTPEPTLRERLEEALRQLRMGLAAGELTPEQGYIMLTDLVRGYLEERYGIPVSTRTTPEFLAEVNGADSPLPRPERPFLREFLEAADKVKFAALTPDIELLDGAIVSAVRLVAATSPVESEADAEQAEEGGAQ